MRYQTLSRDAARHVRQCLVDGVAVDLNEYVEDEGDGEELTVSGLPEIGRAAAKAVAAGEDPEAVEHSFSGSVYLALRHVPVEVRDDRGFWSWVTLGPLFPFTRVREAAPKLETLGIGSNPTDTLGLRMFLRGQVSREPAKNGDLEFVLASAPGIRSHDFWQSHILRRTTGAEPALAHALIYRQSDSDTRLGSAQLRPFVRDHINRKKRTRATFLMDLDEAEAFLEQESNLNGTTDSGSDRDEDEDDLDWS